MAATLKPDQDKLVRAAYDQGLTVRQAMECTGFGGETIRKRYRDYDRAREEAGEAADGQTAEPRRGATEPHPEEGLRSFEESGDDARVEAVVGISATKDGKYVVTKEDLIRVCEIDLAEWVITDLQFKAYQTGMKLKRTVYDDGGKKLHSQEHPHVVQLFSVSAKLKRILPKRELEAVEALFSRLSANAPAYLVPPRIRRHDGLAPVDFPLLADVCLYDCHFANLSWEPEAGENDDLRLKVDVFANAVDEIVSRLRGYAIEEVIFPVGNDLHHVDTLLRTTTAGTPQDTDGRYAKMIEATQRAVIRAIEELLGLASVRKVNVIYVPGNHDRLTSYHLCLTLDAWFRNCDRVEVDSTFRTRKYIHRDRCLLGYTHGDHANDSKLKSLPTIMAVEQPEAWGQAVCREWKTGHVHTSRSYETLSSNEFNGVAVRRIRALTGPNAWHFDHGYVGNKRGAEVYLYDPAEGYVGHLVANARAS